MITPKTGAQLIGLALIVVLLLSACGPSQSAPTPVPPTLSPVPPADTPVPTIPPTATEAALPHPSARAYVPMAYDAKADRIILFGGQTGTFELSSSYNGETWAYDPTNNKWTQLKTPSGPSNRVGSELAYDAESDRVIAYGGGTGPDIRTWGRPDTWAYDYNTNTWQEMADGPAKHLGARLAYDSESDRIILFGGVNIINPNGIFYYNDTWSYDFNTDTWTEMKPKTSPPGRNYQGMTYDSQADRVLAWGGLDENGEKPVDGGSVWAYDYNTDTWTEKKPGPGVIPVMRDYAQLVYNAKAGRTILFGGLSIGNAEPDDKIWAYNYKTNTWKKLEPGTSPGLLSRHTIVYSSKADRVILFGGHVGPGMFDYTAETWSYDFNTNTWTNATQNE